VQTKSLTKLKNKHLKRKLHW